MHHLMGQAAFWLEDVVYAFESFMLSFFGPALLLVVLGLTGSASWLLRSKKPIAAAVLSLWVVWGVYWLCDWSDLHWKLYQYGMYGRFVSEPPTHSAPKPTVPAHPSTHGDPLA